MEESMDHEMKSGFCGGSNIDRNANVVTFTTRISKKGPDLCSLCYLDLHRFLRRYFRPKSCTWILGPLGSVAEVAAKLLIFHRKSHGCKAFVFVVFGGLRVYRVCFPGFGLGAELNF